MGDVIKLSIISINPHIVCSLCAGYFIDATTITECLHTFCKSCIVKCLQINKCCPQCNLKIHETSPLISLRPDRTMQDIVYKIVPNLYEREEQRRERFYKSRGIAKVQKKQEEFISPPLTSVYDDPIGHQYKYDEQISFCLERYDLPKDTDTYQVPVLIKKFIRCSIRACIYHVKHLLSKKLSILNANEIEIVCNEHILFNKQTLKHVWLSQWMGKPSPMMLFYKILSNDASPS